MTAILSNVFSVVAVVAIIGILTQVTDMYRMIRSRAWWWLIAGWVFALAVRCYIMLLDLWPGTFHSQRLVLLNSLMGMVYPALFIGFWRMRLALKNVQERSKQ